MRGLSKSLRGSSPKRRGRKKATPAAAASVAAGKVLGPYDGVDILFLVEQPTRD